MPHGLEQASILSSNNNALSRLPRAPVERRRDWRAATVFTIGKISFNGRTLPCMVRDLSEGGMRIQLPFPPSPGTRVLIEMRGLDPRLARICWTAGHEAGLMFDLRCHPADVLAGRSTRSDRIARQPRFAYRRDVALLLDGTAIMATVENISVGGVRLNVATPLQKDLMAVLDMALGDRHGMAGEICWMHGNSCGFRFTTPVSSLVLTAMLDTLDLI